MSDNRRLVVTENITVNGVIEFVDDWFDPADQDDVEDVFAVMHDRMASEEALLLGRQTFEDFRGYWPLQTDDASGSAAHLNRVPKYVVSLTMTDPDWANSTVISGRLEDEVAALKAHGGGRELGVTGSISVVTHSCAPTSSTSTGCSSTRCSAAAVATSCPTARRFRD